LDVPSTTVSDRQQDLEPLPRLRRKRRFDLPKLAAQFSEGIAEEPQLVTCVIGSNDLMWRRGIRGPAADANRAVDRIPSGTWVSRLNGPGPRPKVMNGIFERGEATKGHKLFNIWNWPSGVGSLAQDRVHPSDIGYGHMAELAWKALSEGLGLSD